MIALYVTIFCLKSFVIVVLCRLFELVFDNGFCNKEKERKRNEGDCFKYFFDGHEIVQANLLIQDFNHCSKIARDKLKICTTYTIITQSSTFLEVFRGNNVDVYFHRRLFSQDL